MLGFFFLGTTLLHTALADCNDIPSSKKVDCGYSGIDQNGCQAKGCCWVPDKPNSQVPWCFFKNSTASSCFLMAQSAQVPFSNSEVLTMYNLFRKNINIQGVGAVVAAPDQNTPGGSYYYHWERDGALTMRALQEITQNFTSIKTDMKAYAKWVVGRQNQADPNGIDVRTEPKYEIPSGTPYTRPWCRPQNDGPGLRATALIMLADTLLNSNSVEDHQFVDSYLWTSDGSNNGGAIVYDLDYILNNYQSTTCDLWEEVQSDNFFWNRFTMVKALRMGAAFATRKNDADKSGRYASLADTISQAVYNDHWNNEFVLESQGRQKDGAVIVGFNTGFDAKDGRFSPISVEVAKTVETYNYAFCQEYAINTADSASGVPGVLYGRYPGDHYAGGNPWVLTTAALAQLLYRAAAEVKNGFPSDDAMAAWKDALNLTEFPSTPTDAALMFLKAGDSVLLRIREHVKADGFHLDEQIDRNTGTQTSAKDLTWSYAEVLNAMAKRGQVAGAFSASA